MTVPPYPTATSAAAQGVARLAARLALGVTFLSAVADRFGLWGPPGTPGVGWGDFRHFVTYTAQVNGFLLAPGRGLPVPEMGWPHAVVVGLAWLATGAELGLGLALLAGVQVRRTAAAAGGLLLLFALALTLSFGPKKALDFSVWSASAAAFLLAASPGSDAWSVDRWARQRRAPASR